VSMPESNGSRDASLDSAIWSLSSINRISRAGASAAGQKHHFSRRDVYVLFRIAASSAVSIKATGRHDEWSFVSGEV
jgi:hypothetical protein